MIPRILFLLTASLAFAGQTFACSIPVFRYALDRWPADPFIVQVPEKEDAAWKSAVSDRSVDMIVQPDAATTAAKILFPESRRSKVLQEPVTIGELPALLTSTARQEVARRILEGDSAVFVFLGNGSPEDAPALALVEERLKYLATVAALPEQDPHDPSSVLGPGPTLKVAFSLLKLDRNDPAEKPFINMLMAGLTQEEIQAGKPVAFPIFGRGRVLAGLTGDTLTKTVIDDACQFLLGACSCQVKEMNPGWDLLIDFDWEQGLQLAESRKTAQPQAAAKAPAPVAAPERVVLSGTRRAASDDMKTAPAFAFLSPRKLALVAGSVCLLGAALLFVRRR